MTIYGDGVFTKGIESKRRRLEQDLILLFLYKKRNLDTERYRGQPHLKTQGDDGHFSSQGKRS